MRRILFLALSTLIVSSGWASTYYVSPSGADLASGSEATPLKTLTRAAQLAGPGDTVLIATGIYRETLAPQKSGREEAPIIFAAAPGALPIISGCDRVTGWTKRRDGVWEALLAKDLGPGRNQLFCNESPLTEARYPKKTSGDPLALNLAPVVFCDPENNVNKDGKPTERITFNGIKSAVFQSGTLNRWAGAYFFGHGYEAWAFQCARVASSDGDHLTFDPSTRSGPWFGKPSHKVDPARVIAGEGAGFIFGTPACLDAPGEWVLVNGSLQFIPPVGVNPDKKTIEARQRPWTVDLKGKNHIVLRGLRLVGGAARIQGDFNRIEDCSSEWGSHFLNFKSGYSLNGGLSEGVALSIEGAHNVVQNCRITHTAGAGISLRGSGNRVTRCLIEDVDYAGTYGSGISVGGENQEVTFNTIHRAGRDCMQITKTSGKKGGHRIFLNDISQPGRICKDCGIIYAFGIDALGEDNRPTRIAFNWVHDNRFPIPAPGIYLDNYTQNFLVDHNVIWSVPNDAGVRLNAPCMGNRIINNTLFYTKDIGEFTYNVFPRSNPDPSFWISKDMYSIEQKNNLYLADVPESQLKGPDVPDFSLKLDAPAIAKGEVIPGISERLNGKQPDLGAYQTGLPSWRPGRDGTADSALIQSLGIHP